MFVWFISNMETMRFVCDRFNVTLSSLERIIKIVSEAVTTLRQEYIKWPRGRWTCILFMKLFASTLTHRADFNRGKGVG